MILGGHFDVSAKDKRNIFVITPIEPVIESGVVEPVIEPDVFESVA